MLPSGGEEGAGAASAAAPGTSSPADGALVARLMDASRGAGASLLVSHLRSSGADAAATAEALLSQPQAQLRAHGLLAARLAGRADLVLGVLVGGDAGVWKAASPLLCQMDPGPACTAQLLDWLLHAAPPAHRNDFLTRLGRLPPRQLGAALFAALLAEGRVEAALRLVRHAGEQADAELAPLLREQLVERQGVQGRVPTWARQAWKRLAVARPVLALELLRELWGRVQREVEPGPGGHAYSALMMLRRAVLALLHGSCGPAAAEALLISQEECCKQLEKQWGHHHRALDGRLARENTKGSLFAGHHARQQMRLLLQEGPAPDSAAGTATATALCMKVLQSDGRSMMRWAYRLHRRGLLSRVLQQATLQGRIAGATGQLDEVCDGLKLLRVARLATAPDAAATEALLAGIAAAEADHKLFLSGRMNEEAHQQHPWRVWPASDEYALACVPAACWPVEALVGGVGVLMGKYGGGQPAGGAAAADGGVGWSKVEVLRRLRAHLLWEPAHRAAVLAKLRTNQPLADERASLYRRTLEEEVPPGNAEAVNEVVPFLLSRTRNERAFVRLAVLSALYKHCGWQPAEGSEWQGGLLPRLRDEHVPLLEAAVAGVLEAPDGGSSSVEQLEGLVAEMLRQGVLRPHSAMLGAAIRLIAALLRCTGSSQVAERPSSPSSASSSTSSSSSSEPGGNVCIPAVLDAALQLDTLISSADLLHAVRTLLAELLPLYKAAGQRGAANAVLGALTAGTNVRALQPLRQMPELVAAVEAALRRSFPRSRWGAQPGQPAERPSPYDGGPQRSRHQMRTAFGGRGGRGGRGRVGQFFHSAPAEGREGGWVASCMPWWLSSADGEAGLHRAKALLELPGGKAAMLRFINLELCARWLLGDSKDEPAPPAALWWRELVFSHRQVLQALVEQHPALCRRLLKRGGSSGALCQALLRERLWSEKLYGVLPEYDSAALAEVLSAPADSRLKGMQAAMAGYRVGGADGSTFWDVKREMGSADYRRWPPAVQAQLRQLASAVAGEASAHAGARVAAVCLLLRLQDATVAELEPLVDDSQLTAACLLAASLLPDKRQAAHFLQSKLTCDAATHAASALRRLAAFLTDGELAELGEDLLSTAGLRTAAWQQVVALLLERGSPQALELVYGEMRRSDLTPSMRCGLLNATAPLCALREVAQFWEQCAALHDKEVGADVIGCADADLLKRSQSVARWWTDLVLGMLRRASDDKELTKSWAGELGGSEVFAAYKDHPAELGCLLDSLAGLAASAPGDGSLVAVWLLCRLVQGINFVHFADSSASKQDKLSAVRSSLSRFMEPLLDAAAAEHQEASAAAEIPAAASARPATDLLLQLFSVSSSSRRDHPFPNPWQVGVAVPPSLVPLLRQGYCQHLAASAAITLVSAAGGGASLAAELARGATAAPTMAHTLQIALALLLAGCPSCLEYVQLWDKCRWRQHAHVSWDKHEQQRLQYVRALLEAAQALTAHQDPADGTPVSAGVAEGRLLLAGTLAAVAWMVGRGRRGERWPGLEAEALGELRRCLQRDSTSLLRLALDQHTAAAWELPECSAAALGAVLSGAQAAQSLAAVPGQQRGRRGKGARGRRGNGARRLTVRINSYSA